MNYERIMEKSRHDMMQYFNQYETERWNRYLTIKVLTFDRTSSRSGEREGRGRKNAHYNLEVARLS